VDTSWVEVLVMSRKRKPTDDLKKILTDDLKETLNLFSKSESLNKWMTYGNDFDRAAKKLIDHAEEKSNDRAAGNPSLAPPRSQDECIVVDEDAPPTSISPHSSTQDIRLLSPFSDAPHGANDERIACILCKTSHG
jgi:hypothetical protein